MYSAKIDGQTTTFGTSGFLYRSNKLMYDRMTNTLWSSLTGAPVIGELARRDDLKLDFFPVSLTTWEEWAREHPDTKVLSNETGYYSPNRYEKESDPRSIYYDYREDPTTMFPIWNRDPRLEAKREVLGLTLAGVDKAYPVTMLRKLRVVNDTVGDRDIVILASGASSDARVFERMGQTFALAPGDDPDGAPLALVDEDGAEWEVRQDGLHKTGGGGEALSRIPSLIYFWFGWFAFHPDTLLYEAE